MCSEKQTQIMDPVQRVLIEKKLSLKNMRSVKLTNMPKRYNYSGLVELAPEMTACRILYDSVSRRPKNYCYLEFSSNEVALQCINKLNGAEFRGKKLNASIGADLSESAGTLTSLLIF